MRDHLPKLVIVGLMVLVVGVPFVMQYVAADEQVDVAADAPRLIVISPHNEQIRFELEEGFNRWREAQGLDPVEFDWRAGGGTSDLRKQVLAQLESAAARGVEDQGLGADLFFGGGEYEHNALAGGVTVTRGGERVDISATVPPDLPQELIDNAFPEPTLGGEQLYHDELYWIGTTLASFGIVYNRDVLDMLGVPEPTTWEDLANPRLRGWIALADPSHSGSIAAAYHAIIRRLGWNEGWNLLRRVFANARYFASSSSKVPVDVSNGEAAIGMAIDFYGRYQAGAINNFATGTRAKAAADDPGASPTSVSPSAEPRVGYIDPIKVIDGKRTSMTAINADPISLLRAAPHRELAEQFIGWMLTQDAQRLWQRRVGTPGGPIRFELRRQPIRRDLYTAEEKAYWTDPEIDPFATAQPFPDAMPSFYSQVAPIAHAMAIDLHSDLTAAWNALQSTDPNAPAYNAMYERFFAMPEALTIDWPDDELAANWQAVIRDESHPRYDEVAQTLSGFKNAWRQRYPDDTAELKARVAWTQWFRDQYEAVVELRR